MRPGRDDGPAGRDDGGCGDGDGNGGEGERRWELQRNRHAGRVREGYEVVVESGEVGGLREGDMVELVAEARYPGWENRVWEAGIRVEGVDDLGVEGEGEGGEGEL